MDRPAPSGALDDIVAARMKDLADRLAAGHAVQKVAHIDAPLAQFDVEIQPVSLAAIAGLRALPVFVADDDDWLPTMPTPMLTSAPSVPSQQADVAPAIFPPPVALSAPAASMKSSETASERNLQSLLAVLEQPTPLRLAGQLPLSRLVPASPSAVPPTDPAGGAPKSVFPIAASEAPSEPIDRAETSHPKPSHPTHWAELTAATDEPLMLADQSESDIRLVDLIKRQQTLLDELNRYPPAPVPADAPADPPAVPASTWSVLDQLAPTVPIIAANQHHAPSSEAPPPLPSTGILRLAGPSPDDFEHLLPERSPMIIERARAELSARHGASNSAKASSPIPAFAAGVAVAFAIAGSLFFVL
ncbi:MAG: hypothetical protein ABI391_01645 [Hyphomicrobiaceae bacterium]